MKAPEKQLVIGRRNVLKMLGLGSAAMYHLVSAIYWLSNLLI